MAKQLNVDVNLNTAKAEAALKNLQQLLTQAIQGAGQGGNGTLTKEIVKATQEAAKLKTMLASATDTKTGQLNLSKFNQQLQMNGTNLQHYSKSLMSLGPAGEKAFLGLAKSVVSTQAPVKQANTMLTQLGTTLKNTARWQLSSSMLHAFIGGIQNAFSYARGLNDSLNSIRIVTGQSAEQMDKFAERANKAAKTLSTSTLDYTDAALIYYQQGIRDDAEIKARTDATIKMANVTGQSAQKVSEQMTAIWNNFADGSTNLEYFADVITALGANTASSSAEISQGLQKFAAVADTVGLSYEYATSALATVVATTRQSADVVGTALKTLFARIQSLNLGETLEDGTTLGKYSKALDQVGISIKDQNGELRSMDDILDDMGAKWETLNKDQQVALAQTVAGQRQYTQLVALMDNWDFMKENLQIAYDSEGTLEKQQEIYEESWKAAKERVKASMQGLTTDLISDDFFIGFNDAIATAISGLDTFIDSLGGLPGLFGMIGVVATKFFSNQVGQQMDKVVLKLKEMTGIAKLEQQTMQNTMLTTINNLTKQGATGAQQVENEAIARQIALSGQLLARKESLAQADLTSLQTIVELAAAYDEVAINAAKASEAAQQRNQALQLNQQSQMRILGAQIAKENGMVNPVGQGVALQKQFAAEQQSLTQTYELINQLKAAYQEFTSGTAKYTPQGLIQLSELLNQLKIEFEEVDLFAGDLQAALNWIPTAPIQNLIEKQAEYNRLKEEAKALETAYNNAPEEQKAAALERMTEAQDRAKIAAEELKMAEEEAAVGLKQMGSGVEFALNSLEAYIDRLATGGMAEKERAEALKETLASLRELTQVENEEAAAAERSREAHAQASQAIANMKASATVTNVGKQMTSALSAVSSLAMGVSSLKSAFETLNNTDLSFGEKLLQVSLSMSMGLSMTLSGLMQIGPAMTAIGKSISGGLLTSIALATGQMEALTAAQAAYGEQQIGLIAGLKAMKGGFLSLAGTLALYAGLIAGIVVVVASLIKYFQALKAASPEGQLKTAQEEASNFSSALQEAKSASEELNSSFDKYNSARDKLNSCVRGTQEWTEALRETNNEVLSLLAKYPQLASMEGAIQQNSDGSLSISKKAQEQMIEQANKNIEALTWGQTVAQQKVALAQQEVNKNNLAKELVNEIQQGQVGFIYGERTSIDKEGFSGANINYRDNTQESKFDLSADYNRFQLSSKRQADLDAGTYSWHDEGKREALGDVIDPTFFSTPLEEATQAFVNGAEKIYGKTGKDLTDTINQIMTESGITGIDAADWARAYQESEYAQAEMAKIVTAAQAQRKAEQVAASATVANQLNSEQIIPQKNIEVVSGALGNYVNEITKIAKDNYVQQMESDEDIRKSKGQEYVKMLGLDADSVYATDHGIKYMDASGNWTEATNEMIAAALAAADGLNGVGEAAQGINTLLNTLRDNNDESSRQMTDDMINSFMKNGDLSEAKFASIWDAYQHGPNSMEAQIDELLNNVTEETLKGTPWEGQLDEFKNYFKGSTMDELKGFADTINNLNPLQERLLKQQSAHIKSMQDFSNKVLKAGDVTKDYSSELYKLPKSYDELNKDATETALSMQHLNEEFVNNTKLTNDQREALLELGIAESDINDVLDENGFIENAEQLNEYVEKLREAKQAELDFAEAQLQNDYHQLTEAYKEELEAAAAAAEQGDEALRNMHLERAQAIQAQIQALEGLIAKYEVLNSVISGSKESINKIAEARQLDQDLDLTEITGTEFSNYGKMVQAGEYGFARDQFVETFIPKAYRGSQSEIDRYMGENLMQYADVNAEDQSISFGAKGAEQFLANLQKYKFGSFDDTGGFAFNEGVSINDILDTDGLNMQREMFDMLMSSVLKYTDNGAELFQQLFANSENLNDQIYANDLAFNQAGEDFAEYLEQVKEGNAEWDPQKFQDYSDAISEAADNEKTLGERAAEQVKNYQQATDSIDDMAEALSKADEQDALASFNEIAGTNFDNIDDAVQKFTELQELAENPPTGAAWDLGIETLQEQLEQAKKTLKTLPDELAKIDFKKSLGEGKGVFESLGPELQKQLKAIDPEIDVKINEIDTTNLDNNGIAQQIQSIVGQSEEHITKTLDIVEGENTAKTAWEEVQNQGDPDPVEYVINGDNSAAMQAWNQVNSLGNPKGGTYTIKATVDWSGVPAEMRPTHAMGNFGFHKMQGSLNFGAKAFGNAFAEGKMGSLSSPAHQALVGELGQELVVNPHSGMYYTVGDSGAEFVDLPKDAIVFNHRQTEQLLKFDKINTRGQALVQGNAFGSGSKDKRTTHVNGGNANWFNQMDSYSQGQKPQAASDTKKDTSRDTKEIKNSSKTTAKNTGATAAAAEDIKTYEQELVDLVRDEVDVYKTLDKTIKGLEHTYKQYTRNNDRLWGKTQLENMQNAINAGADLYQVYLQKFHKSQDEYQKSLERFTKAEKNGIQWVEKVLAGGTYDKDAKFHQEVRTADGEDMVKFYQSRKGIDGEVLLGQDAVKYNSKGELTWVDSTAMQEAAAKDVEYWQTYINEQKYTNEEDKVNAENQLNNAKARHDYVMKLVDEEDQAYSDMIDFEEKAQDLLEELHDLAAQKITQELEIRWQLQENELKLIDLRIKMLGDEFTNSAKRLELVIGKIADGTKMLDATADSKIGAFMTEFHALQNAQSEADAALAAGRANSKDPNGISAEKWREITQNNFDKGAQVVEDLIQILEDMETYFSETIDKANQELQKYTDQMGHYVSILDHMANLMDLTGRKFDFENKEIIIRSQMNNLKNDLEVQSKWYDELHANRLKAEEHLASMKDQYSQEEYDYEYNNYVLPSIQAEQEAEEKKYASAEAYLQKLEELYQNAFDRINAEWEKLGTNGQGWDYLTSAMERAKSIQDEYLTTTNKIYETNTLMRKLQKDINNSDNQLRKESLINFQKEVELAQQDNKLAKSKMEILKARYEVLQAEMALEDAKDAKSVVRLQRDSEGNYGYVYTADQDAQDDAAQNLADKQNDLYNLALGYQNDYQEKATQAMQEFQTKWMELEQQRKDGIIASDEELHAKQQELYDQYSELMEAYHISLTESELVLEEVAAEGVSEAWSKSWEDRRGNLEDFMGYSAEAHDELNGYLEEINEVRNTVVEEAKLGLDDVKKKTEELTKKDDELKNTIVSKVIPALSEEIARVGDLTAAFDEQAQSLRDLIQEYYEWLALQQQKLDEESGGMEADVGRPDYSSNYLHDYAAGNMESAESQLTTRAQVREAEGMSRYTEGEASYLTDENGLRRTSNILIDTLHLDGDQATSVYSEMGVTTAKQNVDIATMDSKELAGLALATAQKQGISVKAEDVIALGQAAFQGKFDTGGYTGEWGSEGKIALLHEKELVLNQDDTQNILDTVNILRSITQQIDLQSMLNGLIANALAPMIPVNNPDNLQQEVTIHAEFPNVTEKNEIEEALKSLVNEASQFVKRN